MKEQLINVLESLVESKERVRLYYNYNDRLFIREYGFLGTIIKDTITPSDYKILFSKNSDAYAFSIKEISKVQLCSTRKYIYDDNTPFPTLSIKIVHKENPYGVFITNSGNNVYPDKPICMYSFPTETKAHNFIKFVLGERMKR